MPKARAHKTQHLIDEAYAILQAQHPISVRGVAYQLFARGVIPSMEKKEVKRVSEHLKTAREYGEVPWEWVTDDTRQLEGAHTWEGLSDFGESVRYSYRKDYWQYQGDYLEVWSEKATIKGVIAPVLDTYGVKFQVHHGWSSATAMHDAAEKSRAKTKPFTVLYLGDYDPSGMRMSERDIPTRMQKYGGLLTLRRIALTADDVGSTSTLPWFDAITKRKDSNYTWYTANYGTRCWELDAMRPNDLRARLEGMILGYIDLTTWNRCLATEAAERTSLAQIVTAFRQARV